MHIKWWELIVIVKVIVTGKSNFLLKHSQGQMVANNVVIDVE